MIFPKYIKKYDQNLRLIENKVITGAQKGVGARQIKGTVDVLSFPFFSSLRLNNLTMPGFTWDGHYFLITGNVNKDNICAAEIDRDGIIKDAYPLFADVEEHRKKEYETSYRFSPDSSHIIFTAVSMEKENRSKKAYISVFKKGMIPLWHTTYNIPAPKSGTTYQQAIVSNNGTAYILVRNQDKKEKNVTRLRLIKIDGDRTEKSVLLNFGSYYVEDVHLSTTPDNKPSVIGFYHRQKNRLLGSDGVVYGTIDTTGGFNLVQQKEFTEAEIGQLFGERAKARLEKKAASNKDLKEDVDLRFMDFMPTPDGGMLAVAEEQYIYVEVRTSQGTNKINTTEVYHYIYGDLMAIKLDKDFKIEWIRKAAKKNDYRQPINLNQIDKDYACYMVDGNVYLLFNDFSGKKDNIKHPVAVTNPNNVGTYMVQIDRDGRLTRTEIIKKGALGKFHLDLQRNTYLQDNKIFFFAARYSIFNRKTQMGSITINP